MATPVKVRRLSDEEGRQLQRIVRRGGGKSDKSIVKWRRALVVLASAGGNDVPAIARLVQTSPDRVREMIHSFNDKGIGALDPQWAGGRPRRITTEQRQLIIKTATKRPRSLGQPFTRWSVRKLAQYLATKKGRKVTISASVCARYSPRRRSPSSAPRPGRSHPIRCASRNLPRIEYLLEEERERIFAFDEFGPLAVKPEGGSCWAEVSRPQRLRANYHKPHGTRQLFAWYSVGADRLYGRIEPKKGMRPTLRALKSIRASVPDGEMIYVILDNLNHHKGPLIRQWCADNAVELAFTPTYGSWANPIEAHFGPLREFSIANSDHQSHAELAKAIRDYIRWRNAHTTDPEILALERKHRAALRGEAQRRWGQPRARAA